MTFRQKKIRPFSLKQKETAIRALEKSWTRIGPENLKDFGGFPASSSPEVPRGGEEKSHDKGRGGLKIVVAGQPAPPAT